MQPRFGLQEALEIGRRLDRAAVAGVDAIGFRPSSASRIAAARWSAASSAITVLEPIVPPELLPKWMMMLSTPASAMARASSTEVQNALVNRPLREACASTSTSRA